jgi:hypothetical protein
MSVTYETDFYTWTQQQVALLKSKQFNAIDLDNLIEEIESMGRSEKRELESRLTILLQHLLKWQYQPIRRGRSWQLTIKEQRFKFLKVLKENPSLKKEINQCLQDAYQIAVIKASKETKLDENVFPIICPWSINEITEQSFYPE